MQAQLHTRLAQLSDKVALTELIDRSVRELQASDYNPVQIESLLQYVYGVDTRLIEDGTYYLVEVANPLAEAEPKLIVGSGGWSKRKTLFGGDRFKTDTYLQTQAPQDNLLNPKEDAARIRAFFVHPEWARRGIGSLLMRTCENAAIEAGFNRLELMATLTGQPLYAAWGYEVAEPTIITLQDGVSVPFTKMSKTVKNW